MILSTTGSRQRLQNLGLDPGRLAGQLGRPVVIYRHTKLRPVL
jgi:hypothetical protein